MTENSTSTTELVGRELLIDVASGLFMDHGYDGVSMQQIATAARMTKGSPYYHFENKEDLFLQAFQYHVTRIVDGFLRTMHSVDVLRDQLTGAFAYMLSAINPGMIRMMDDFHRLFILTGKILVDPQDDPQVIMRDAYEEAFANSGLALRLPAPDLADVLMALQMGVMQMQVVRNAEHVADCVQQNSTALIDDMINLFLNGAVVTDS